MTPEARAAAQVALAQHDSFSWYLYTPDIPEGVTVTTYMMGRPRKRTRWQRLVRRLNGHG